jgi:hypothetical protein
MISRFWQEAIVPALVEYIRIPAKSPHFDPRWQENRHIDAAVEHAAASSLKHAVGGK